MKMPTLTAPVLRTPCAEKITSAIEPSLLGDVLGLACLACQAFPPGRDRNDCLQACGAVTKTGGGVLDAFLPMLL